MKVYCSLGLFSFNFLFVYIILDLEFISPDAKHDEIPQNHTGNKWTESKTTKKHIGFCMSVLFSCTSLVAEGFAACAVDKLLGRSCAGCSWAAAGAEWPWLCTLCSLFLSHSASPFASIYAFLLRCICMQSICLSLYGKDCGIFARIIQGLSIMPSVAYGKIVQTTDIIKWPQCLGKQNVMACSLSA